MNSESIELNDEMLSAYLDGALNAVTAVQVERALEGDPGARVRLERMRVADQRLREAFALQPASQDDPIVTHLQSGTPLRTASVRTQYRRTAWWSAAAASVLGVVVGYSIAGFNRGADGLSMSRQNELIQPIIATALQSVASGETFRRYDQSATVLLTFKASDGRFCRAFKWHAPKQDAEGLACRERAGNGNAHTNSWRMIAWDATAGGSESAFQTAGASDLIDSAMDRMGGNATLNAEEERALIEGQWQP